MTHLILNCALKIKLAEISDDQIAVALMELAATRGTGKTFCPSEVARSLSEDWRVLMADVRRVAADLPLVATQRGTPVDPVSARGPIRLEQVPG